MIIGLDLLQVRGARLERRREAKIALLRQLRNWGNMLIGRLAVDGIVLTKDFSLVRKSTVGFPLNLQNTLMP